VYGEQTTKKSKGLLHKSVGSLGASRRYHSLQKAGRVAK